jgi:DNA-binding SARP family transcriptional activator/class 3 adenylate cyclase
MAMLRIELLGGLELIGANGAPITVSARKVAALAAYLAMVRRPQGRDALAAMFWGDRAEEQARMSLRQALSALRKALGEHANALGANVHEVSLIPGTFETDVAGFESLVSDGAMASLAEAARLYRGPLLGNVQTRCPVFDDWLDEERQRLRNLATDAFFRGARAAEDAGDWALAGQFCALVDPFFEDAMRCHMRVAAMSGRRADALSGYETFSGLLRREFGILPQEETTALSAEIRAGSLVAVKPGSTPLPDSAFPDANPSPAHPPAELRQATALVVEIDNFTDIAASLAPEESAELLNRYFAVVDDAIVAFGGSISDHVADSAMALFGLPAVHEDDPNRALRTALAIRDGCRDILAGDEPLALRIALSTGQVLSAQVGSVHFRKYTATGETINLAWWLAQHTTPGDILIAEETRQALRMPVGLQPAELSEPVPGQSGGVWSFSDSDVSEEADETRPFVGRRLEQRQIEGLVEACQERGMGHVLVLRGEAGIGKSRLVAWARDHAHHHGLGVNLARVFDFGSASSRHVIKSLVLDLLDVPHDAGTTQRHAAIEKAKVNGVINANQEVLVTNLFDLPMSPEDVSAYAAMNGDDRHAARRAILASLVRWRAAQNPVMIVIEDVHWADDVTISYLADLAASMRDCPTLLLMTTRVEDDPIDARWRVSAGGAPVTTMDLGPLSPGEAQILARSYGEGSERFLEACVQRAAGHPLFLDQLLANPDLGADNLPPLNPLHRARQA